MSVADTLQNSFSEGTTVRLRARWILPIDLPPIENGEISVADGRIVFVGKASGRNSLDSLDLGLCAILPGLVNVHAHLEYTVLRGLLEDIPFFPWIRTLNSLKSFLSLDEWVASATLGAAEMLASGITTVGDAADAGASVSALLASGQRGIVFREVFGIEREPTTEQILTTLHHKILSMRGHIARMGDEENRVRLGISPHAPYTVRPELFRALAEFARQENLPQTIHLAESVAESELITEGTGPFAEMFLRRGIAWTAKGMSPVRYLDECGALIPGTLAVHTVHVSPDDIELLKARGATIAHCPKSNGKLAAGVAPLRALLAAGLPVGLGTDSVASNNSTDMFEEMRSCIFQARNRAHDTQAMTAREALRLATSGGAAALGMESEIGTLTAGKRADLCVVRLDGLHLTPTADDNPEAALVYSARASDVFLTMAGGQVLYEGNRLIRLDVGRLRQIVAQTRRRLRQEANRLLGTNTAART